MTLTIRVDQSPLAVDAHGVVRVGGTRVTLDTVIAAFHEGVSAEAVVQQYPVLQLADVYVVFSYYLRHRADVDAYLSTRAAEAARIRAEIEARGDMIGLRERLLARRQATQ